MSQLALHFNQSSNFRSEDYLVSSCNQEAHAWIIRWQDWPQRMLSLYGPTASGKTHLSHLWAGLSQAIFLDADHLGTAPSDTLLGNASACVLERTGMVQNEEALFHLLNHVKAQGIYLLLNSIDPLPRVSFCLPDLKSRLSSIASVGLKEPDDEALFAVLFKHFSDRQLRVSTEVIRYIINHTERSFRSAHEWVERIDCSALSRKKPVSLSLVRELIRESYNPPLT